MTSLVVRGAGYVSTITPLYVSRIYGEYRYYGGRANYLPDWVTTKEIAAATAEGFTDGRLGVLSQ